MINTEARESHDKNCNFAEKTAILPNELKLGCPRLIFQKFFFPVYLKILLQKFVHRNFQKFFFWNFDPADNLDKVVGGRPGEEGGEWGFALDETKD